MKTSKVFSKIGHTLLLIPDGENKLLLFFVGGYGDQEPICVSELQLDSGLDLQNSVLEVEGFEIPNVPRIAW